MFSKTNLKTSNYKIFYSEISYFLNDNCMNNKKGD